MNPFFKNINIYSAKKSIFLRKISKIEDISPDVSSFFEKLFKKFEFFWTDHINPEKFPEFYYLDEKFIKKAQNGLDRDGLLEMG